MYFGYNSQYSIFLHLREKGNYLSNTWAFYEKILRHTLRSTIAYSRYYYALD